MLVFVIVLVVAVVVAVLVCQVVCVAPQFVAETKAAVLVHISFVIVDKKLEQEQQAQQTERTQEQEGESKREQREGETETETSFLKAFSFLQRQTTALRPLLLVFVLAWAAFV